MFSLILTALNGDYSAPLLQSLLRTVSIRGNIPSIVFSRLVHFVGTLKIMYPERGSNSESLPCCSRVEYRFGFKTGFG